MLISGSLFMFPGHPGAFPAAGPVHAMMPTSAWYHYIKVSKPAARALAKPATNPQLSGVRFTVGGRYGDSYTRLMDRGFFVMDHGGFEEFVCNSGIR